MSFLLPLAVGAGSSLLGGLLGNASGTAQNAAMNALNTQDENFQLGLYASEISNQEQLSLQSTMFDQMMDERSDQMSSFAALARIALIARALTASRPALP